MDWAAIFRCDLNFSLFIFSFHLIVLSPASSSADWWRLKASADPRNSKVEAKMHTHVTRRSLFSSKACYKNKSFTLHALLLLFLLIPGLTPTGSLCHVHTYKCIWKGTLIIVHMQSLWESTGSIIFLLNKDPIPAKIIWSNHFWRFCIAQVVWGTVSLLFLLFLSCAVKQTALKCAVRISRSVSGSCQVARGNFDVKDCGNVGLPQSY